MYPLDGNISDIQDEFEGSFFSHMGDTNPIYTYMYLVIYTRLSTDRIHEGIIRLLNVGVPEHHVGPSQPAGRGSG